MQYKTHGPIILDRIKDANHILLVSHEKPDGDTLGASLAMAQYLNKEQKKYKHFCYDKPADYFSFLPLIEKMTHNYEQVNLPDHDLVITIDCGDIQRTKIADDLLKHKARLTIINIDHHQSNDKFGHHNLVIPEASSTSEIIYKFFAYHKIEPDKYMATNLLTGILTDTMNFTNAATNQESLKIAAELLKSGARVSQIINQISQNKNLASLKLWGKVLTRLEFNAKFNFAYTVITKKDLLANGVSAEEARDGLANFLSMINDVDFIMVLTEEDNNSIKGSLRTTKNNVDVAKIAKVLGGGGHAKAAGFKVNGKLIKTAQGWQIK